MKRFFLLIIFVSTVFLAPLFAQVETTLISCSVKPGTYNVPLFVSFTQPEKTFLYTSVNNASFFLNKHGSLFLMF